jgi:hypothetical protein
VGETASVTGDGKSTVDELIESQINSDPRRGTTEDHPLNRASGFGRTPGTEAPGLPTAAPCRRKAAPC